MPRIKKVISSIINKATHISNVTISNTKHQLTNVDENLIFLHINNDTLGMAKISDYVDVLNNSGDLDLSNFQMQTCISSNHLIQLIFPILFKKNINILYIDDSIGEPLIMFDESKGCLTLYDIVYSLLPSLVLEDGSTAGYSALSSIDDVCLVIDKKKNGPLQQLLDSTYGKSIIQKVKLQNSKIDSSDIGKIILLLDELTNFQTLSKINLNPYNYQSQLSFSDYSVIKDFIIDFDNKKYQPIPKPDSTGWYCACGPGCFCSLPPELAT